MGRLSNFVRSPSVTTNAPFRIYQRIYGFYNIFVVGTDCYDIMAVMGYRGSDGAFV